MFHGAHRLVITDMRYPRTCLLALTISGVLAAQGVPNFAPPVAYTTGLPISGPSTYWSVAADFNGDGLIDLAAPDGHTIGNGLGFSVVLAKPGGGYATPVFRSVGFVVLALCSADFNNDGLADLVLVSPSGVAVVLADGAGGFGAIKIVSLPLTPMFGGNAATGDFVGVNPRIALKSALGGTVSGPVEVK